MRLPSDQLGSEPAIKSFPVRGPSFGPESLTRNRLWNRKTTMNNGKTMIKLALWFCLVLATCAARGQMQYNYFDDYLSSLNEEQQAVITGESKFLEGSGDDPNQTEENNFNLPIRTGLSASKDVTCCSLGQLAGDKGYHCFPKFYAARILLRNQNRAHNRKMGFYGRDSVPNYGTKLMRTFEQCVASRRLVFSKCCHLAAEERKSKPHFDSVQRKRYELKMRKIRMPKRMQVDNYFLGV